jgi:WD40 repeat protein
LEYKLTGHEQTGYAIGFSPDSKYLISGSYDQTFKLWNLERKGNCTLTFHGYEETVYTSKFIDNRRIFIGSSQGMMYFYDFE